MKQIIYHCERCGKPKQQYYSVYKRAQRHYCSKQCHMKTMNEELNKTRMTDEVKEKISVAHTKVDILPSTYKKKNGKKVHRTVVEKYIGRPLRSDEIVHHIDGDKRNNNLSNLAIMTQSEHAKLHHTKGGDKVEVIPVSDKYSK